MSPRRKGIHSDQFTVRGRWPTARFAAIATLCLSATYDTFDHEGAVLINLPRLLIWVLCDHMPSIIITS